MEALQSIVGAVPSCCAPTYTIPPWLHPFSAGSALQHAPTPRAGPGRPPVGAALGPCVTVQGPLTVEAAAAVEAGPLWLGHCLR